MRRLSLLLVVSFTLPVASSGKSDRHWSTGSVGVVASDTWCKAAGIRGTCGPLLDVPTQFIGPDAGTIGPTPVTVGVGGSIPAPITQIIQVEGPDTSYTVKFESLSNPLRLRPHTGIEFAVAGKHLFLRVEGKEYRTEILASKKRKP